LIVMKAILVSLPSGKRIDLDKGKFTIGRNKSNDFVASERHVSGKHCHLLKKGRVFFIEDLDSANGTFINGERISGLKRLHNNDTISLGQKAVAFQFRLYSPLFKNIIHFSSTHLNMVLAVIAAFLVLGFLSYVFIVRNWGKADIGRGLQRLQKTYGKETFPPDGEFKDALEETMNRIREDSSFDSTLEKRNDYLELINRILKGNNVPPDFSFIVWVESHYNPYAYNGRTGARGMWQLLAATARQYGLRVDRWVDERLDPEKSTQAAALYLKDLVSILGKDSFLLVLAAYNAGDYTILYSLKQIQDPIKDRNFWYLYKNNLIPQETKQYVLKILALIILTDFL
jgi:pSer/pThr/pTyr-binding forkhead associated (FHA) protein